MMNELYFCWICEDVLFPESLVAVYEQMDPRVPSSHMCVAHACPECENDDVELITVERALEIMEECVSVRGAERKYVIEALEQCQ